MRPRPRVFIGSSTEGIKIAQALQVFLEDEKNDQEETPQPAAEVRLWTENPIFVVGELLQNSLIRATQDFDFAVMIFSGDDAITSRNLESPTPRDNVVFEAGLFAGALGFSRLFVVTPKGVHIKIPSDLAGFNQTTYTKRQDDSINVSVAGRAIATAIRRLGVMRHDEIEPKIRTLVSRARSAYNIDHALFHEYLANWCDSSLEESDSWPRGSMTIDSATGRWLASVFKQAKVNIFSTSIPLYMTIWRSAVGKQLLKAQAAAACPSTRVFVFPSERSVTQADKEVMTEHAAAGIQVRTFYDQDIAEFAWNPGNIDTDFTFIDDGEVIGVTEETRRRYRSRWYFKHPEKTKEYAGYRESLINFSEPFN
ncbi:MAG TPA: nucleotide-binding protein [Acidisarcina sp.]